MTHRMYDDAFRPHIGAKRDERTNVLLVPPTLGSTRPTTYDLPPTDFVYGHRNEPQIESAKDVMLTWQEFNPKEQKQQRIPDFVRTNKMCVSQKLTTAKAVGDYKRDHDVPVVRQGVRKARRDDKPAALQDPEFVFGRPEPRSVPAKQVVENDFQLDWVNEQIRRQQEELQREAGRKARPNRAADLAPSAPKRAGLVPDSSEASIGTSANTSPFKMRKFANVPSKVSTRRADA